MFIKRGTAVNGGPQSFFELILSSVGGKKPGEKKPERREARRKEARRKEARVKIWREQDSNL